MVQRAAGAAEVRFFEEAREVARCLVGYDPGDRLDVLGTLDALARLCLEARRRGWQMRLDAHDEVLAGAVERAGLAEVLGLGTATPSARAGSRTPGTGPGRGNGADR